MQNIGSKLLKNIDRGMQLRSLFHDFLFARKLNSHLLVDSLTENSSFELITFSADELTHSEKSILSTLLNSNDDPLLNRETAIQNLVLRLLKVDQFRKSSPYGDWINKTCVELKCNSEVQKWLLKCYMQIALLELADDRGLQLKGDDKTILKQYNTSINKVYIAKFFSIYAYKLPLLIPFLCCLIFAFVGDIPISSTESIYIPPVQAFGLFQFINNYGGGYYLLFTAVIFYTSLFIQKLLLKSFSIRSISLRCLKHIKERMQTYILTFSLIASIFSVAPQTLFYSNDSVGYLISAEQYSEANSKIEESDWHIEQKNYAKSQVIMAQKNSLTDVEFKQQFIPLTDQIVADYKSGKLPEWANDYVVANILEERGVESDMTTFDDARYYLYLCFFLYFFAYLMSQSTCSRVIDFKHFNKVLNTKPSDQDQSKIKKMLY